MPALWRKSGRSRVRTALQFLVIGIIASILLLAAVGAAYESLAEYRDRQVFSPHGQMIDVGGYRLHIDCSGEGSPTVVLDSGAGEPGREWALVQPEIAKFTRVCSYDRAGYGWSDSGPLPRTSERSVSELHTLLTRAGIAPPYIIAGHSLGGMNMRLYAARYPHEVAGVVLVDASHPDQELKGFRPSLSPLAALDPVLLRLGVLRALFVLDGAAKVPRELRDELEYLALQDKTIATDLSEVRSFPQSAAQVRTAGNLGDKPLIVLTAEYSAQRRPELRQVWLDELQPDLVRLSSQGKQQMVNAGHFIPLQKPDAVVQAVRQIWEHADSTRHVLVKN